MKSNKQTPYHSFFKFSKYVKCSDPTANVVYSAESDLGLHCLLRSVCPKEFG